jgi:2-(1,2-epoxy-1,2-dihydrophenyl)acetyl-CoA isomerase
MTDKPSYATLMTQALQGPCVVDVTRETDVAILTMNDPERLNPLSAHLTVQLHRAIEDAIRDPDVRTIVLTGAGGAFSAGGDLRAMRGTVHDLVDDGDEGAVTMWRWIRQQFGGVVRAIVQSDKVFIAAVDGAAAGVGLAFALACDLLVLTERARLVFAFGKIGLVPEVGTSWLLTRRLGYTKTFELFVSGETMAAAEALRLGLANEVVAPGHEVARARVWAERVRAMSAPALAMTKPLLRAAADMGWHQAIAMEEFAEPLCFTTHAHRSAVAALLDRRRT